MCTTGQLVLADSYTQAMYERMLEHENLTYHELDQAHLNTRYPSAINQLYDIAKEGMRDLHEGLWALTDMFGNYLLPSHTFSKTPVFVRYAPHDELCYEERQYIHIRTPHVQEALEKFLEMKLDRNSVPHISFCFSGGGFRAMILTLGFLQAAQELGLFDATMFMAGLSGSTWAMAPWIASNEPMDVYIEGLSKKIEQGLDHINNPTEITLLMQQLIIKTLHNQPISAMDVYGAILANTLLEDSQKSRMKETITQSHQDVLMGFLPLPIYTTIRTNNTPYEWMECTPFEIGSSHLQAYIPTWAYGRKFKDGASLDYAPEQSMGYFLGVFGSAFEVNFSDIIYHTHEQLLAIKAKLPRSLQGIASDIVQIIKNSPLNELRLFPSMLRNFTYNIPWSPLRDDKNLCLVDAGIDFNLPLPPLLRPERNVDIIIIYDASGTIKECKELKRAEAYAHTHNLKFPKIDYEHVDTNVVSVFKGDDAQTPIIIYFPRVANPNYSLDFDPEYCTKESYCSTTNFTYSQAQFSELSNLARTTLKEYAELIKSLIKEVIERKTITS